MASALFDIRNSDTGTVITASLVDEALLSLDVTGATVDLLLLSPNNGLHIISASVIDPSVDKSKVSATLGAGDINESGVWKAQIRVVFDANNTFRTPLVLINVEDKLD